ncbi:hypothetical protein BurJ1DRAFT_2559 [Burkholderiales bacterium JOSHI_001]|nr:hypothetical protein BurJ1DRAFT_2559 [Burkholderiales bacterium JOSHI_001]
MTQAADDAGGPQPIGIYRRWPLSTWTSGAFASLTPLAPSGQALALYLSLGPHTGPIPGAFVAGRLGMAEALNWEIDDFDRCAGEVIAAGIAVFDRASRLWWLPGEIRNNPPQSPNVVRSWRHQWASLPECDLKATIRTGLFEALSAASAPCAEAFSEVVGTPSPKSPAKASRKPSAKPSPNQEAGTGAGAEKQEPEKKPRAAARVPAHLQCPDDVDPQVWADWLELRAKKKAPVTASVISSARAEAAKAGVTFEEFLRIWCFRGSQGLQASWIKPDEIGQFRKAGQDVPEWQKQKDARIAAFAGYAAAKPFQTGTVIDGATKEVTSLFALGVDANGRLV